MQGTVEGYIDHIIFRNEENGYTVLSLIVDGEELTLTEREYGEQMLFTRE